MYSIFYAFRLIGVPESPPVGVSEPGTLALLAVDLMLCLLTRRMRPPLRSG